MSSLDLCCVCSSSMHPTCLCPYYEPKVDDGQDNEVVVATTEELCEAYVLGDRKNLDEDNSIMLSLSVSQHELQVCKLIAVSFPYMMHKELIYIPHLLYVILVHIFDKYLITLLFVRKTYIYDTFD